MRKLFAFAILVTWAASGAEDPWAKVHDLKSGTELRIVRKGSRAPVVATMDELTDDNLLVATKKEQIAIPRDQIERIDFRPKSDSRISKETRATQNDPPVNGPEGLGRQSGPTTSTSTSYSIGSKPDFQTIYRATAGVPPK